jgi:RHS repeat-associated protein
MSSNTYQFTGRVNDGTGLYDYRVRYYSPGYQRFISEDPAGLRGGVNIYVYAQNDPVEYYDPLGLTPKSGWHWPWSFGGSHNTDQSNGTPNSKQPQINPNDFRPHASKEGCKVLEEVEFFSEALDMLDTASGIGAAMHGEEVVEPTGPGFPSMFFPGRIISFTLNHFVANCE